MFGGLLVEQVVLRGLGLLRLGGGVGGHAVNLPRPGGGGPPLQFRIKWPPAKPPPPRQNSRPPHERARLPPPGACCIFRDSLSDVRPVLLPPRRRHRRPT